MMSSTGNEDSPACLRIAVVDDHPIIRSAVRVLLESEPDFKWVGESESVQSGMNLLVKTHPDAVVLRHAVLMVERGTFGG